jgi:hypothetical protein
MKKRTVYWVPKLNIVVILSMVFMLASAVLRLVWLCSDDVSGWLFWSQGALPLLANLTFLTIVLRDSRDRLFRTAIPVWLGCIFFALKALTFPSLLHTLLCLCLYTLVLVLYTATVTGTIPTQRLLIPLFALPLLYHIFVEDMGRAWTLWPLLQELSVLCCMAALLCISVAMKKKDVAEGEYVKGFGDRNDGRRLRTLSPIFAVSPYLMKTRNTSQNFIADSIEITEMERYIVEKRKAGMKNFGILHVLLAAYVRTCARYPGLNRFISGQRIFCRDREIEVNMTIKKEMSTDSPDTVIKVEFDPADTPAVVYEKFNAKVQEVKNAPLNADFDKLVGAFNLIPGLLLKFFVFLLQTMDYFGLLPRFLTKLSPFHGSMYITSMASLGIPPIYHHLYDFGNLPCFLSYGSIFAGDAIKRDGTRERHHFVTFKAVLDERICDGYYYASAFRRIKKYLLRPELLEQSPETVNEDVD